MFSDAVVGQWFLQKPFTCPFTGRLQLYCGARNRGADVSGGGWLVFFFPGPQDIGKVRVPPAVRAIARKPEEGLKRPHINRIDASRRRGYNKLLRT